MLPFSVKERAKPGPNRRSKEIGMVSGNALSQVIKLEKFPGTVIDVEIMILQANASTRCAGINAAAMALAHAGVEMREMVASVSIGKSTKKLFRYYKREEDWKKAKVQQTFPFTLTSRGHEIVHLQLDGNIPTKRLKKLTKLRKTLVKRLMNTNSCFEGRNN
jgi:exosome complex component RRP41